VTEEVCPKVEVEPSALGAESSRMDASKLAPWVVGLVLGLEGKVEESKSNQFCKSSSMNA
jgi:hypothetical protein